MSQKVGYNIQLNASDIELRFYNTIYRSFGSCWPESSYPTASHYNVMLMSWVPTFQWALKLETINIFEIITAYRRGFTSEPYRGWNTYLEFENIPWFIHEHESMILSYQEDLLRGLLLFQLPPTGKLFALLKEYHVCKSSVTTRHFLKTSTHPATHVKSKAQMHSILEHQFPIPKSFTNEKVPLTFWSSTNLWDTTMIHYHEWKRNNWDLQVYCRAMISVAD